MKISKTINGLGNIITIWFVVSFDIILLLGWIDAFFPSVLITQRDTFLDGVMHIILTIIFFIYTYALADHYGKE